MFLISIQKPINSLANLYCPTLFFFDGFVMLCTNHKKKPYSPLLNNWINIFSMCAFPYLVEGKNAQVPHDANKTCWNLISSRIIPKEFIF